MGNPVKILSDWGATGLQRAAGESISSSALFLNGWLKNAKATRFFLAVVVLLAALLGACTKEQWSAYQLSERIVFETQHSIAELSELQMAHRYCRNAGAEDIGSSDSQEQGGVDEYTEWGFCESVLSRTTAHPGSLENAYQLWMRGKTRALPDSNAGESLGGDDS